MSESHLSQSGCHLPVNVLLWRLSVTTCIWLEDSIMTHAKRSSKLKSMEVRFYGKESPTRALNLCKGVNATPPWLSTIRSIHSEAASCSTRNVRLENAPTSCSSLTLMADACLSARRLDTLLVPVKAIAPPSLVDPWSFTAAWPSQVSFATKCLSVT